MVSIALEGGADLESQHVALPQWPHGQHGDEQSVSVEQGWMRRTRGEVIRHGQRLRLPDELAPQLK